MSTILVAEDEGVTRTLIALLLQRHGFTTLLAENGEEALHLLEAAGHADLLVTDLMMPRMDGLDLICELRQHPQWSHIPVVVVTVMAERAGLGRLERLGCSSFLVKPVKEQALIAAVRQALETPAARKPHPVAAMAH